MGVFTLDTSDDCPAPRLMIVECPPLAWRPVPSIPRRISPRIIEPTAALRASVRRHRRAQGGSPMLRSIRPTRAAPKGASGWADGAGGRKRQVGGLFPGRDQLALILRSLDLVGHLPETIPFPRLLLRTIGQATSPHHMSGAATRRRSPSGSIRLEVAYRSPPRRAYPTCASSGCSRSGRSRPR